MEAVGAMILVLCLLCCSIASAKELGKSDDELVFVQVIFRHGERTIRKPYPNDPLGDKSHWPEGFAQLTLLGKRQTFVLGEFLARRYGKFLDNGTYSPEKVSVMSSDIDRTINSANLVLAGMFPPKGNQIWNERLLWQPIPVHSIPTHIDYFISGERACKRYLKAREDYGKSAEIQALIDEHKDIFDYVEKHAGTPIRTIQQIKDVYDVLDVEHRLNKTIPAWAREIFIDGGAFGYVASHWQTFITGTKELKRWKAGFLLKQMFDRFKSKALSLLPDQLMQIYSGHEITVSSILNSLGVFELHVPPFASSVIFEMRRRPSDTNVTHYIQVFYRNSSAENLTPLHIPNCGTECPLARLYELYDDILVDNIKECDLLNE